MSLITHQLAELSQRLAASGVQLDLDALYLQFEQPIETEGTLSEGVGLTALVPRAGLAPFLRWLQSKRLIDANLAEEVLADLAVEVTGLDVLAPFYDQTQTVDLKHGDLIGPLIGAQSTASRGGYQLLKQVGAGAMGQVHLAKDRLLRRTVAFKRLLQPGGPEAPALQAMIVMRFLGEAQITSQLDHPHVIPIYGLESGADGKIAYTMKMIQGKSLKQKLAEVRAAYAAGSVPDDLRTEARLRLFLKILDALGFAHSKGVIHRDLKPANIMLGRYGEVYVMDWGIARLFGAQRDGDAVEIESLEIYAHEAGQIVGTPRYMAPEQAAGMNEALDQRSDLFALGLILFEMVSLRQAIQAKDMTGMLQKVIRGQLEPLKHLYAEEISPALAAIIARATARRRRDRYQHVADLAADLRRYLNAEKVMAHQESPLQRLQREVMRHRRAVLPALLGVLLLTGGASLAVQVLKQSQLEQAEFQQLRTAELLMALSSHGQQVGGRFQLLEGLVQELSAAAGVALSTGQPLADSQQVYMAADFVPGRAPNDWLPAGGRKLSFDWPVFQTAPGQTPDPHILARLLPLRHSFYRLFSQDLNQNLIQDRDEALMDLPRAKQVQALRSKPGTLVRAFIGLNSGLYLAYPGQAGIKPDYDPRLQAWYRQGLARLRPCWGNPTANNYGPGKVLSCVQALRLPGKQPLGVAGIDISLSEVSGHWLPMSSRPEVQNVSLLTREGQLLASTSADDSPLPENEFHRLSEALKRGQTGFERFGADRFLAYTRLGKQDWMLVIEGDLGTLLKHSFKKD